MLLKIVVRAQDNGVYNVKEETVIIVPVESYSPPDSPEEISTWYFDPKHFPKTELCRQKYHNVYLRKEPHSDIRYLLFFSSNKNEDIEDIEDIEYIEDIGSRRQFEVTSVTVVADYPEP